MPLRQGPATGTEARTVDVITHIATRFYLGEESQTQIARDLGLDPSTVSRYLKRAREVGIVHIEIRPPRRIDVDLGRAMATRFGLARVIVAPTDPDVDASLGPVAAEYIEGLLRSGGRIGISWGRTLESVIRNLRPGTVEDVAVAQLAGGVDDPTPGIQGHDLVRRAAQLFPGSRVQYLHAPAIVGTGDARNVLLADRTVETALEAARTSDLALVGIGAMDTASTLYRGGHVERADWTRLLDAGAVGNMNTRFFDASGAPIDLLDRRTIAITWDELRAIPTVVAVAAGVARVAAIRGALATGAVDVLVTDEATAAAILRADGGAPRARYDRDRRSTSEGRPA